MDTTRAAPVEIAEKAAVKAISLSRRDGFEEPILRLRVTAGGCSGFSYKLSFERTAEADDAVVTGHGLTVLIDPRSVPIVQGSTIDFDDSMLGGGFRVRNPQAVSECACGESFSI